MSGRAGEQADIRVGLVRDLTYRRPTGEYIGALCIG